VNNVQQLSLPSTVPAGIEVWLLELNLRAPISNSDFLLLSKIERAHALHFYTLADQVRSVATRATLRKILAKKLAVPPEQLHFATNHFGKPYLHNNTDIEFNVSHAGRFALIATSINGQVGVDIEDCNRQLDVGALTEYVFTSLERQSKLMTKEEFIERWVAKESVLKALGVGISEYLQAISVLPLGSKNYRVVSNHLDLSDVRVWLINVPDCYVAALAVKNHQDAQDSCGIEEK